MFRYKTAWFSNSVPQKYQDLWKLEGGSFAGWRTADYLFSKDATSPDTLRIYNSKDYLMDEVTIFHCLFLSACEKRQSVTSVPIGHYVLPPVCVQEEVRKVIGRLIWECEDDHSVAQDSDCSSTESSQEEDTESKLEQFITDSSQSEDASRDDSQNNLKCHVSMEILGKYEGELRDFHILCSRCCRTPRQPSTTHMNKV